MGTSGKHNLMKFWIKLMQFGKRLGCHQIAERSFFFKGYQFPVCARCTGVILGEIVSIFCLFFFKIDWWILLLLLAPMAIDWGLQFFNILKSDNIRRIITGLLGGFSLTYLYYYLIISIIKGISMLF